MGNVGDKTNNAPVTAVSTTVGVTTGHITFPRIGTAVGATLNDPSTTRSHAEVLHLRTIRVEHKGAVHEIHHDWSFG